MLRDEIMCFQELRLLDGEPNLIDDLYSLSGVVLTAGDSKMGNLYSTPLTLIGERREWLFLLQNNFLLNSSLDSFLRL